MQTVLFHETIFGPIHSRRLGVSLGVNLMPNDGKSCSFEDAVSVIALRLLFEESLKESLRILKLCA